MPGFNRTGPMGQGPMTGRRLGRCTNFGANLNNRTITNTNETNPDTVQGNWFGRGFGFRRGTVWCRNHGLGFQNRFRRGM